MRQLHLHIVEMYQTRLEWAKVRTAAGKVNVSQSTYAMLKDNGDFTFSYRGKVAAKGKGELETYFVEGRI